MGKGCARGGSVREMARTPIDAICRASSRASQPGDRDYDDALQLQALGMGAWYCFRDLGVNKSNTRDILT
jgi:hypothetical protein